MKNDSAGALLLALITTFIVSLLAVTLVLLMSNQYRVINKEIERIEAFYRAQAGMEWAIYNLYSAIWEPGSEYTITIGQPVTITIEPDTSGVSEYRISVRTSYEG